MTKTIEILSAAEAAAVLGLTDGRIRQLATRGEILVAGKLGNAWFFDKKYVEELARTGRPRKNSGVALTIDDVNERAARPPTAKAKSQPGISRAALTLADVEAKNRGKK